MHSDTAMEFSDDLGREFRRSELTVAVAESLTGGRLSARFAAAADASEWYRGAVVSYSRGVKHDLLDVPPGPVVCRTAVAAMAEGVAGLLDADISLSVTGAGGPDPQDDQPPGTVWMALHDRRTGTTLTRDEHFDGSPQEVVDATCDAAIAWLLDSRRSTPTFDVSRTAG